MRQVKDDDMVFLMKTSDFETDELIEIFEQQAINYEVEAVKSNSISHTYDLEFNPSDKNIYIKHIYLLRAKEITFKEEQQEEFQELPTKKRIVVQILSILAFMMAVAAVTLGADFLVNFIKNLF